MSLHIIRQSVSHSSRQPTKQPNVWVSSVSLKSLSIVTTYIFSVVMKFSEQCFVRAYKTHNFNHDSFVGFYFRCLFVLLTARYVCINPHERMHQCTKCIATKNKSRKKTTKCNCENGTNEPSSKRSDRTS